MRSCWFVAATALALISVSGPGHACVMHAQLDLNDVRYADVVLVGRISKYEIIRDVEFRKMMLANPKLSADMRKLYEGSNGLLGDYARFNVTVDRVLAGKAPTKISVTWDNSTFGEPDKMATGPFLIALRKPSSKTPPLRGPSATISPSREPQSLTVLQAPCSSPFIFDSVSDEARAVERILAARPR